MKPRQYYCDEFNVALNEKNMPAITVKNIPDELYEQLKNSAQIHRRSINSELIACLEQALQPQVVPVEQHLADARALRSRLTHFSVKQADLDEAKNQGRP